MKFYFFRRQNDANILAFDEIALHHNIRTSKLLAATVASIGLILCIINQYTNATRVLMYPNEYYSAIAFIFLASAFCFLAFIICNRIATSFRTKAFKFFTNFYALIIVISSLWITFVMQHNPSNTMSIFVLGILSVGTLWIFRKIQTIVIAILILILFNGGLHYFQTDSCKLFTNYITGTCVSIFFVCISRVNFSVNYNRFKQLKKIETHDKEITRVNEMQTEILAVVAHDLRAPINGIMAITNLLKSDTQTEDERNQYYEMILSTCNRSNGIVEDLLSVVRNDEKNMKITYTCVNDYVEGLVNQVVRSGASGREIIYTQTEERVYAQIDHQKMQRVFDNLLSNAVKFTNDDGVILIDVLKSTGEVCIQITDNGIGIPRDMIPYLFHRFTKAGRTGLKGEVSHGLGLNICELIIKQHRGDISVRSDVGKGTSVKITLPAETTH
jgi:two-component system, OmpR family, sensor histidine kinase VicK